MRFRVLAFLLLAPLLGGCRYNFVPLIPKPVTFKLPARVTQASLTREGDTLTLKAALEGQFEPGYLKVNWFNNSQPLAEDSVYLDQELREVSFTLLAPNPGAYRATLSFGGAVLRQAELYEVKP